MFYIYIFLVIIYLVYFGLFINASIPARLMKDSIKNRKYIVSALWLLSIPINSIISFMFFWYIANILWFSVFTTIAAGTSIFLLYRRNVLLSFAVCKLVEIALIIIADPLIHYFHIPFA